MRKEKNDAAELIRKDLEDSVEENCQLRQDHAEKLEELRQ